ncbi:peptidyl-prolyl cis-trans isomerase sig-7 [Anopheles bellator]|uniref:peptidyl-prolyl cis-trans isomerase sig-7 n=1 Tax=Anopheles bellator TaxID=139047 RepID=UPI00264770F1|nr:peptidyl-prolyl cis-trans isomerase sig-7 [Anopheles bellator]
MSVVIETTIGDITVDLFLKERPQASLNFLKLCKMKYYNYSLFHTIQPNFIAQTGDPTGSGDGGTSVWGLTDGAHKRYFTGESVPKIKHSEPGLLSMVSAGEHLIGSQFFFTLGGDLTSLDGQHIVIGEVMEGHEVLRKLNEAICDDRHRPYKDVRITHTVVLDDPFDDPSGFREPSRSPSPSAERLQGGRIAADEEIDDLDGKTEQEIAELIADREAKARATILEIVGDIPDADIAPPENVLFVCKLNPVTTDDDLQIIFGRFGKIVGCEVIRDKTTGDSLQYAFIEFEDQKSCEIAYFKMDNVLIDDRRIHVDFSQSVSKVKWRGKGRGIEFSDGADRRSFKDHDRSKQSHSNNGGKRHVSPKPQRTESPRRSRHTRSKSQSDSRSQSRSRSRSRSRTRSRSRSAKRSQRKQRSRTPLRTRDRSPVRSRDWDRNRERKRNESPRRLASNSRSRKANLTNRNSAYLEQRNGRDIRINQGKVDYKNRPYPSSFIQRNTPKDKAARGSRAGGGPGGKWPDPPPRRRSRSRSRDRRTRRSRSRSRSPHGRRSSSRDRRPRSSSRDRNGRNRQHSDGGPSPSRSTQHRSIARAAQKSEPEPAPKPSAQWEKNSRSAVAKRRSHSTDSSSSTSSSSSGSSSASSDQSDERTAKRKKKGSKKKSKSKSRKRKGSVSSDDGKARKKKSKSKKKKKKH